MKMKWACGLLCLGWTVAIVAADDKAAAAPSALKLIPSDAMMFVSVPNIKTLDEDLKRTLADMELTDTVGLPSGSLLAFMREKLPFFEHVDENAAAAMFFMPASSFPEFNQKQVLMLTAKDTGKLLEALSATPAEDGTQSVSLFGQPLHAAVHDKHVFFAQTGALAKSVAESKEGIGSKLKSQELDVVANSDLSLHVSGALFKLLKPMVDMFMPMAMMQGQGDSAFSAKSAEMSKKNMDNFLEGISGLTLGLGLDANGLTGTSGIRIKPGSDLAKQYKLINSDKPLLTGLPLGDYVLAFGGTMAREQMEASFESLEPFFALVRDVEGIDQDKFGKLKDNFREMIMSMTGVRGEIEALDPEGGSLIGISMLVDTSDSGGFLDRIATHVTESKALIAEADAELIDADVKQMVEAISFKRDAAKAGDKDVSLFSVDLSEVEDLDEEEREQMEAVLGDDGLMFRFAAVSDTRIAVAFGGGEDYLARLIKAAGSDDATLMNEKGIKMVSGRLPNPCAANYFVAVDHGLMLAQNILDAVDEEPLPLSSEAIDAPLGIAVTSDENWMRGDMHVPTPLMKAISKMVRTMMGVSPPTT